MQPKFHACKALPYDVKLFKKDETGSKDWFQIAFRAYTFAFFADFGIIRPPCGVGGTDMIQNIRA